MKAVRPYSITGIIICLLIWCLFLPLYLIKGKKWQKARAFEENPRTMNWKDILYFGYKYYFRSPLLPESAFVAAHFSQPVFQWPELQSIDVSISIGGDLMPYQVINKPNCQELWNEIGRDFFASDIVFANLESPLVDFQKSSFVPELMLKDMLFNSDIETFKIFNGNEHYKGYTLLSIANNHTLDMGSEGVDCTIEFLHQQGIRTVGAKTRAFERDFEIIEKNGIKIGFLAFTYSLNQFLLDEEEDWKINCLPLNNPDCPLDSIYKQITACRLAGAEFIICSMHCGNAYQAYPSEVTVRLFEKLIQIFGIDVIAGGHPHNLQPWRNYTHQDSETGRVKNCFAIYSLGDFIAYDIYTFCHLCAYLKIELSKASDGTVVFKPHVIPLVMTRIKGKLKLKLAEKVLNNKSLSSELKDLKVLYDICKT